MLVYVFSKSGFRPEREKRQLFDNGGEKNAEFPSVSGPASEDTEAFKDWESKNKGAKELVDTFIDNDDINDGMLRIYLEEKSRANEADEKQKDKKLSKFEQGLLDAIRIRHDPRSSTEEVVKADKLIQRVVTFIRKRQKVVRESHEEIAKLKDTVEKPYAIDTAIDKTKSIVETCWEGFQKANGKDKALMLGGLAASVLFGYFIYSSVGGKGKGALRNTAGVILGGGLAYLILSAAAKEIDKKAGRPLFKTGWTNDLRIPFTDTPIPYPTIRSQEEWDVQKHEEEVERMRSHLLSAHVPPELLDKISPMKRGKYIKGIIDFATMDVQAFGALYENYKNVKMIPEEDPLVPHLPVGGKIDDPKYKLTPLERFVLMEDIGKTLGIIDKNEQYVEPKGERKNKSILYLMLDWDRSADTKEQEKQEGELRNIDKNVQLDENAGDSIA